MAKGKKAAKPEKTVRVGRVSVYRLNGAWHGRWRDASGIRVSKRLGATQQEAVRVAKKIDKAANAGALGGDPLEQTRRQLAPLVAEYRARLERKGDPKHVATVISALRRTFAEIRARKVSDVTVPKIDAFFDEFNGKSGRAVGTLNHYRGYIRSFFRWLEDCDRIPKSPVRGLEPRVGDPVRRRQANKPDQIKVVLEAAKAGKPYEYTAYLLGYGAGLRQNEILGLRWGDLDLAQGLYSIVSSRQKGGRDTTTALLPDLLEYLKELHAARTAELGHPPADEDPVVPGAPRCARTLSEDRKATVERAGLRYRGLNGEVNDWHAMRHAFCSNLSDAEGNIKTKQLLMRHADISTTAGYDHADIREQRKMLSVAKGLLGRTG